MSTFIVDVMNGISYGLLLFMLSSGLTLIFSFLGVLNVAHASFYMLGAYVGTAIGAHWNFGAALVVAPAVVGAAGALVDRSTAKQGRYTPGAKLKIFSPEKLLTDRPDYVLLLSWNFADEILAQQAEYRRQGGQFIIPIPQVKVA